MSYRKVLPDRRPLRWLGHDYARSGWYLVTIVTWRRACVLGEVVDDTVRLSGLGVVVTACLEALPDHFPAVRLDAVVVMPNHVHAIVEVAEGRRTTAKVLWRAGHLSMRLGLDAIGVGRAD